MFKKPIKTGGQNQLSGKDRKMIKNKISSIFDEECVEKLFAQNEKIICNKITGSKMLIYSGEDYPLLVDSTGKEDFFPSIYVCAAYEPMLKYLVLNEGVETFIFNGANLMWPGVRDLEGIGNFKKDDVVALKNSKREIVAIGAMGCSFEEFKKNTTLEGVAAYVLTYRGDKLWDMGNKVYPEAVIKAKVVEIKKQEPKQVIPEKEQQQESKEKGKGKKVQKKEEKQVKEEKKQQKPKPEQKKQEKKKEQPVKKEQSQKQQSDGDDFMNLVHDKKANKPTLKNQKKKANFSDEQDDHKGKKKQPKKGKKKEQEQQVEQQQKPAKEDPKAKKNQKKVEKSESQQEQKVVVKEHKNKKKGKKAEQKQDQGEEEKPKEAKGKHQQKKDKKKHQQSDEQQHEEQENNEAKDKPKKHKEESDKQQEHEQGVKSAINSQIMDEYLKEAFLNVLKLSKVEGELPIDSGRFFTDYMIMARPEGVKLQVKDSSYKKLGKFYEQMAKEKFIEFKPAKEKKGQQGSTITKINWDNQELKNYVPTVKKMGEREVEEKPQDYNKYKLKLSKTLQIQYVYRLTDDLKKILLKKTVNYMPTEQEEAKMKAEQVQNQKETYLNERDLKQKIEKYINEIAKKQKKQEKKEEEKQKKADKMVMIDYKENEFIYNLLKHQINEYEENLAKEQELNHDSDDDQKKKKKPKQNLFRIDRQYLVNKIMKLAASNYQIIDKENGINKFREGVFKGIQIIAEKVINKNVTRILGLQNFSPPTVKEDELVKQIHGFAQNLQVKFASSATVQNLPGKNAGKEILIQGNFIDELENMFITEYGIKKEYITLKNKLGKKKKN